MILLALDLGSTCGWATWDSEKKCVESGIVSFKLWRGESPGMRFLRFRKWLAETLDLIRPDIVYVEMPHHRGGYATSLLIGFHTRVEEECARLNIPYSSVHTATLKKFIAGNGRASKDEVREAVVKKFPDIVIIDDNHADALALLLYGKEDSLVVR